jgi:hypothetical protein
MNRLSAIFWIWCGACLVWLSLAVPSLAGPYEQRKGNAIVRLDAEKGEGGRVQIRLSDTLHLTVSMEGDSSFEVQPPTALTTSKDWQVRREAGPEKIALAGSRVSWSMRFRLTPLKPGELSLGLAPFRFRSNPETDRWEEITWQPIPVQVSTEVYRADVSELRDIAPPEELRPAPSWRIPLTWTGAALAFLLLLLSGWALWRRRGGRDAALSASQWALRELEAIPLPPQTCDGVESFSIRLSDVVRSYLELRYQLPAPLQTTAEFLETMRRSPQLQPEQQALLRDVLEGCDLVKFARAQPSAEECSKIAALARAFVEQTDGTDYQTRLNGQTSTRKGSA